MRLSSKDRAGGPGGPGGPGGLGGLGGHLDSTGQGEDVNALHDERAGPRPLTFPSL